MTIPQEIIGTIPGWITSAGVISILGIVLKWQLGLKKIGLESQQLANADRADARDHIAEEMVALRMNVASLREELHACEEECRVHIDKLTQELWGEKRQRVAEQISLINIIINSVDAPELKNLLKALESVKLHINRDPK